MAEKVTSMRLKVDLQCSKCYKKVKKVLSKFPQVRTQMFDEKQNMVNITVVCCSPEKIRDKICCKGGGAIKSIEIVEPPKKDDGKKKDDDKPKGGGDGDKKTGGDKTKADGAKKGGGGDDKPKDKAATPAPVQPLVAPPPMAVPVGMVATSSYGGYPCGPYFQVHGQPTVVYDGYYGRPVYDSYGGGGRPIYVSRCDQYFNEENPQGCSIM